MSSDEAFATWPRRGPGSASASTTATTATTSNRDGDGDDESKQERSSVQWSDTAGLGNAIPSRDDYVVDGYAPDMQGSSGIGIYNDDGTLFDDTVKVFHTPADRLRLAWWSFVVCGIGLLFPWNITLSSVDFWKVIYPGQEILFSFSVAYQSANIIGLFLVVRFGSRFSFSSRIVPGFIVYFICMVIFPMLRNATLAITISAVLGFVDSIVQGSIFAMAGMFNPRYVAGLMLGQGMSAVIVSILRVISKVSVADTNDGVKESTYIFFGLSCAVIIICVIAYLLVLERSPVTKHYLDIPARSRDAEFQKRLASSNPSVHTTLPYDDTNRMLQQQQGQQYSGQGQESSSSKISYWNVFLKLWPLGLSVGLVFLVTLSIFPGLTSNLKSTTQSLNDTHWFSVIMVAMFNIGDLIGRSAPSYDKFIVLGQRGIIIGAICRIVFIPIFILMVLQKVFTSDPVQYIVMLIMSISNGYLGTLCMMFGPQRTAVHERETAGTMMVFLLTGGLTGGVWLGLLWQYLINNAF
jgi:solute carrier family 29 (equilibrative nucleoside transporter), member 1/2/3